MDPLRSNINGLTTGLERFFMVYGSLMKVNTTTNQVVPELAESLATQDAQTWTLKLRPNLKFSDGSALDAEAVIYNFNRAKDPASAFPGISAVSQIVKMTAVDATTVEFRLIQPNGSFNLVFTDIPGMMVSPTAIKADPRNWAQKPVGAGAYVMKDWTRDQQMTLTKNANYFDKPKPYIDTIVVRVVPDIQTQVNLLSQGTIDLINPATRDQLGKLLTDKNIRVYDIAKTSSGIGIICNIERVPCTDVRFREAMTLAFDFKAAKGIFLPGIPYAANTLQCFPFGPSNPYCAKDVKVKYNPTRAKKLIDQVKADGINTDISFTFSPTASPGSYVGEYVQQQMAKIGVNVQVLPVTTAALVNVPGQHTFVTTVNNQVASGDMVTRFYNDFHSVGGPNGGRDVAQANNAELDVALEKGRNSVKMADKIAGIQEAQRLIDKLFLNAYMYPNPLGVASKKTLQLPKDVSPNAAYYRYEAAWLKD